jgi:EAL domain-containing protein (putative c-di-GMP-specific phosphodiesterase class I)
MALPDRELSAYFQPIFRMTNGSLFGLEVLARRANGDRPQAPEMFFHLLDTPRSWLALDLSALRHAARVAALLPPQVAMHIFVNLSTTTALDPDCLRIYVFALSRAVGQLGPHRLVVEIPEEYHGSPAQVRQLCARLHLTGALTALDDHRGIAGDDARETAWCWDVVKIDTGERHVGDSAATLATILQRRQQQGLAAPLIILEGIEHTDRTARFGECGCDLLLQGYAYSHPLPLQELLAFSEDSTRSASTTG